MSPFSEKVLGKLREGKGTGGQLYKLPTGMNRVIWKMEAGRTTAHL